MRGYVLAALLLLPVPTIAGGPPDADEYEARAMEAEPEQRHRHNVQVTLDQEPRTDGVHVVVEDVHAGVHIVVDIEVVGAEE